MVVLGALPMILMRPAIGILLWSWLGYMNPHRLAWGFASNFPWAQTIAGATLIGLVVTRGDKRLPKDVLVFLLIAFNVWMVVTTMFAIYPDGAWGKLDKVLKIQLMTLVTIALIKDWRYLNALIWVIVLSLGFYGVKGGIFTLLTGGQYRVRGPAESFIEGNTVLGLALLMVLPLMRYLQIHSDNRWVRRGLVVAMGLTMIAILGTYSRGAFLGALIMGMFLVWKSPYRKRLIFTGILLLVPFFAFLPQKWYDQMESIRHYEQDPSAIGRIHAWQFTWELAKERPITGFGFNPYSRENYRRYAPHIDLAGRQTPGAHSNYFKALGEHGFPGLILYAATLVVGYRRASWIIRRTRDREDLKQAGTLAAMIQVSFVGYAVSGTFLNMTYFDMYYHLLAILVIMTVLLRPEFAGDEGPVWSSGTPARTAPEAGRPA
jgi:probable O-glycosylation ligase (exosortase A-associated)